MLPSLFISHGSPMLALNKTPAMLSLRELGEAASPLARWSSYQPTGRVSTLKVSTSAQPETIHDFGGFPQALFECQYPAPGNPESAEQIALLLGAERVKESAALTTALWGYYFHLIFREANVLVVSLVATCALGK